MDRKHNLALGKPTSQSSTPDRKKASSNAVDGNVNPDAGQGSCAVTEGDTGGSWWQVNLETVRQVREVVITSRDDRGRKFYMSSTTHNFTLQYFNNLLCVKLILYNKLILRQLLKIVSR